MSDVDTLASELLKEVKTSAKRWFCAFCVMVGLEIATILGFVWYITLPVEEAVTSYTQETTDVDNSDVRQIIGGDGYVESYPDSEENLQEESNSH